mmetsp:Transcript_7072/g.17017  ORF Transcript_7072/g.17017 Transcript_7072/m.17017 type:complete len:160 (+) Transcript_7072:126-605(+)
MPHISSDEPPTSLRKRQCAADPGSPAKRHRVGASGSDAAPSTDGEQRATVTAVPELLSLNVRYPDRQPRFELPGASRREDLVAAERPTSPTFLNCRRLDDHLRRFPYAPALRRYSELFKLDNYRVAERGNVEAVRRERTEKRLLWRQPIVQDAPDDSGW